MEVCPPRLISGTPLPAILVIYRQRKLVGPKLLNRFLLSKLLCMVMKCAFGWISKQPLYSSIWLVYSLR